MANLNEGWIKLHRKIINHWIWNDSKYLKGWLTILINVNFEDSKVVIEKELIECNRGQSLYSLNSWCNIMGNGWSIQKLRTFLKLLENDSMIKVEGLRKTTRITVIKYDDYQILQQTNNRQTTRKQQADNKLITTTKEYKESKEVVSIETRKTNFIDSIDLHKKDYSKDMLNAFFAYWSEIDTNGNKMRFENEKYFEVSKRLITWFNRSKNGK